MRGFESEREENLLRLMRTDEMTGLYKASYFRERVQEDLRRSQRYGWPLTVALISIDDFPNLRERFGAVKCSSVVATVASMIRKGSRETDLAARVDDACFGLLLVGTDEQGVKAVVERLSQRISTHLFLEDSGEAKAITFSAGMASFAKRNQPSPDLLVLAKDALTRAQSLGGNRYTTAETPSVNGTVH